MNVQGDTQRFAWQPHIDGLRALAVLAVIVFHFRSQWLPGGFVGVDVFFVISGFVVSASVSHWKGPGLFAFASHFYARRAQRIVPALLVCLLATSLACVLLVPFAWLSSTIQSTGRYAFFGLSNLFLAFEQENYFAPTAEFNPFLHTWSLGVEEQFYLLFPLLFFAWTRGGRWRTASTGIFAAVVFASLLHAQQQHAANQAAAFYLTTTRLWELAAGVLLFQCLAARVKSVAGPTQMRRWMSVGAWLSLSIVIVALFTSHPQHVPYPSAMLPVAGTLGLLGFLHLRPTATALHRLLGSRLLVAIGRRSYSLYLWHWPVLVILRWTTGIDTPAKILLAATLTALCAELSFRFVENPFRYAKRLRSWPAPRVVAAGVAALIAGWLLSGQWIAARSQLSLSVVSRHAGDWYALPTRTLPARPECLLTTRDERIGGTIVSIYSRSGCDERVTPAPTLFAFGDSHAIAYSTMLTQHVLQTGSTVLLYQNPGCTFLSLQPERETGVCEQQADAIVADIQSRAEPGDVLFLAALRVDRLGTQFASGDAQRAMASMHATHRIEQRTRAETEAVRRLETLVDSGLHVVIDAPKPVFRTPAFRCADAFNRSNPICAPGLAESRDWLIEYREPVMQSLQRIRSALPGVTIWDPFPLLCPTGTCRSVEDDMPLYFDGDHLSAHGNRLLYPDFAELVNRLTDGN